MPFKRQYLVSDEVHYNENSVQTKKDMYDPIPLYYTSVILYCTVYSNSLLFHNFPIHSLTILKTE